jgi:hypothetical protein
MWRNLGSPALASAAVSDRGTIRTGRVAALAFPAVHLHAAEPAVSELVDVQDDDMVPGVAAQLACPGRGAVRRRQPEGRR